MFFRIVSPKDKGERLNESTTNEKSEITALALGGFDGLHRGHRALIDQLGSSGGLLVLEHSRICITPGYSRKRFTDYPLFICDLDAVHEMSPQTFVAHLQKNFPKLKKFVVGYDFRFGKNRAAGAYELRELFDGETVIVAEVSLGGAAVHSTRIRLALINGNVSAATILLGREHMIEGRVVRGQGVGKKALYPTLNLEVKKFIVPKDGVYAAHTEVLGRLYPSVAFVGNRLSTDGSYAIETHILDENATLEGVETAAIFFNNRIRDNRRFESLSELKEQIAKDIRDAKNLLEENICTIG